MDDSSLAKDYYDSLKDLPFKKRYDIDEGFFVISMRYGTTGKRGGDWGHGSRAFVELKNNGGAWIVKIKDGDREYFFDPEEIGILVGGDAELDAFSKSIEILNKDLRKVIDSSNSMVENVENTKQLKSVAYFKFKDGSIVRFEEYFDGTAKGIMTEDFSSDVEAIFVPIRCKDRVCMAIIEEISVVEVEARGMGGEKTYEGSVEISCPGTNEPVEVKVNVWEYPELAFNYFEVEVNSNLCKNEFVYGIDEILRYIFPNFIE